MSNVSGDVSWPNSPASPHMNHNHNHNHNMRSHPQQQQQQQQYDPSNDYEYDDSVDVSTSDVNISADTSKTPPVTAKSARNFWQQQMNQPRNTTSWKKQGQGQGQVQKQKQKQKPVQGNSSQAKNQGQSQSQPQEKAQAQAQAKGRPAYKDSFARTKESHTNRNNNGTATRTNAPAPAPAPATASTPASSSNGNERYTSTSPPRSQVSGSSAYSSSVFSQTQTLTHSPPKKSQVHVVPFVNHLSPIPKKSTNANANTKTNSTKKLLPYSLQRVGSRNQVQKSNANANASWNKSQGQNQTSNNANASWNKSQGQNQTSNNANVNVNVNNNANHNNSSINQSQESNSYSDVNRSTVSNASRQSQESSYMRNSNSNDVSSSYYSNHSQQSHHPQHHPQQQQQQRQYQQQQQHQQQHQHQKSPMPLNRTPSKIYSQSQAQRQETISSSSDGAMGEMQIKLDIAAAKLLTEEMKYKDMKEQLDAERESHNEKMHAMEERIRREYDERYKEWMRKERGQREEMEELYMEIERLHESHRAEREVMMNEKERLEGEKEEAEGEMERLNHELRELKEELVMVKANHDRDRAVDARDDEKFEKQAEELRHTRHELKEVQGEIEAITKDFKDLADETERLEIELEAVTEDRDELLRRSVVYHNQAAQASNSPDSTSGKGKGKKHTALSESSRQDYEEQQHQAEIGRLRTALHEQEEAMKVKEGRIKELESMVEKSKAFDLDLSAIEVNTSAVARNAEDKEARKNAEEKAKAATNECSKLTSELISVREELATLENERDKLKDCLADAMQELEETEANSKEKEVENDVFTQELMQIIKEKDTEIEALTSQLASEVEFRNSQFTDNNNSGDSFQEELNNVVEWLDSSTRINGSPSIEMRMKDPTEHVKLSAEDETVLQPLYRRMKDTFMNLFEAEEKFKKAEKTLEEFNSSYDTPSEASFERGEQARSNRNMDVLSAKKAEEVIKHFRIHLKKTRDEIELREKTNEELRKNLSEAADLIKPLKEHVTRIENERLNLQADLASSARQILKLERASSEKEKAAGSRGGNKPDEPAPRPPGSEDKFGQFVQISAFDLRKKDDEIVNLKVAVNQLRDELKDAESFLAAGNLKKGGELDEMPTPTKSNRGKDRSLCKGESVQPSNEEDDTKSREFASKVEKLQKELKKKTSAEATLQLILRDTSTKLTMASTQAEQLANEKNDAENRIKFLEREKLQLQEELENLDGKEARDRDDKLSIEVSDLKAQLKTNSKERKKLKKNLNSAVGMLNALRSHVETSEKERKKLKKHLRMMYGKQVDKMDSDGTNSTPEVDLTPRSKKKAHDAFVGHVPDPDRIENETTILNLKSHIVEMEHEIRALEERLDEVEVKKPRVKTVTANDERQPESVQIQSLREELLQAGQAHELTKTMLDEVSEINKEMLNDLKQTEDEAAEAVEELNALLKKYDAAQSEIEDAKYVATFALQKLEGAEDDNPKAYQNLDGVRLADCINKLERQVTSLVENNFFGRHAVDQNDGWETFGK